MPGRDSLASAIDSALVSSGYSERAAVQSLQDAGHTISGSYLKMLRSGERNNPTIQQLTALASLFDVEVASLLGGSGASSSDSLHSAVAADPDARAIAIEAARLTPKMRVWLLGMMTSLPDQ